MAEGLILVAASGLARETAEAARAGGLPLTAALDDDPQRWGSDLLPGVPIVGGIDRAGDFVGHRFVLCAGKGTARASLGRRLSGLGVSAESYATIVHPAVTIPPSCTVGAGSVLLEGVTLTCDVRIGRHVVAMPRAVLTHDCVVEDFATLCAGTVLGGNVRVAQGAYLGMACAIRQGLTVGAGAMVGMGAVVLRDVGADECVVGVPARSRSGEHQ